MRACGQAHVHVHGGLARAARDYMNIIDGFVQHLV
jgi:hypothetical protein